MSNRCRAILRVRHDVGLEQKKKLTVRVVSACADQRAQPPSALRYARTHCIVHEQLAVEDDSKELEGSTHWGLARDDTRALLATVEGDSVRRAPMVKKLLAAPDQAKCLSVPACRLQHSKGIE
eukprot:4509915-Alexandrium_andersonii.AAC.1